MCGIAGLVRLSQDSYANSNALERMVNAIKHRGPDDSGVKFFGKDNLYCLGHTRLAILDVSKSGHQPMLNNENGDFIVFNGEIYNFQILKKEIIQKFPHVKFSSNTDTEVILKGYAAWGTDVFSRLRGIFALAIWDNSKKRIILARDHVGVKPLYYYKTDDIFVFSSEVRSVLSSNAVPRRLCTRGLLSYLSYGSLQEPYTLIDGVLSLNPGSWGQLEYRDGEVFFQVSKYWLPRVSGFDGSQDYDTALQVVAEKLKESVAIEMISDVPLGAFLSGGIDSSTIVSLMKRAESSEVRAFSVSFADADFDESRHARSVADKLGVNLEICQLTESVFNANLESALNSFDQPSVDGLNTWFVSKMAKESGLTVALSGIGGDELFCGYNRFKKHLQIRKYFPYLQYIPDVLCKIGLKFSTSSFTRKAFLAKNFPLDSYFLSRELFDRFQIFNLVDGELINAGKFWFDKSYAGKMLSHCREADKINKISFLETVSYMLSTLLRDADQMSMAHALEVRVPLIDFELIETMFGFSGRLKVSGECPKSFLLDTVGDIPIECASRPKQGFVLPYQKWILSSMAKRMEETFFSPFSVFCDSGFREIWARFKNGKTDWTRVWSLYVLDRWLKSQNVTV